MPSVDEILNSSGSDRHAVDPLEVTREAIEVAHAMLSMGRHQEGRNYFRQQLEAVIRSMCPVCGRTDDHEDEEHKFVGARQRILGSVRRG